MNDQNRTCGYELKPDWPEVSKRWTKFWSDEVPTERVLMSVHSPARNSPYPRPEAVDDYARFHTDPDFFIRKRLYEVYSKKYHGDAFPATWPSLTGGYLGILLGAKVECLADGVVWNYPVLDDLVNTQEILIDRDSPWYRITMEQLAILEQYRDEFMIFMPDYHGISDALVSIRGAEGLAYDMIDEPELVHEAAERVLAAWGDAYDEVHSKISKFQSGTCIWLGMWHPCRLEVVQEDFAELISANQYNEFFRPYDERLCRQMDATIFHLHNTMTRYQEIARQMEGIDGTQFRLPYDADRIPVPVDGYKDLLANMHCAGKKTWYHPLDEIDLANAIQYSDPRHLFIQMEARDDDEAERLLDIASECTQKRLRELGF